MRATLLILAVLTLSACEPLDLSPTAKTVDAANLPPLSSREQALMFGADGAMQQQNFAAAERDYLSAISYSAGHVEAHLALARLYEKQKAPDKVKNILMEALKLQPDHAQANYMLGKLHLSANRYADAYTAFHTGSLAHPEQLDLALGEAITNDMMGKHAAARTIYQRLLGTAPASALAEINTNLGMSYLLSGDPKKAIEILKIEVKKPTASSVARHNLALAYGAIGRHSDAKILLHNEIDEETRQLAIARLKEYWQGTVKAAAAPVVPSTIHESHAVDAKKAMPAPTTAPKAPAKGTPFTLKP